MPTIVCTSWEFDNTDKIVQDLVQGLAESSSNALGLLVCDSMVDSEALIKLIAKEVPFPIIGGTTLSFPFTLQSAKQPSASMIVLDKDGMKSSVAVSAILSEEESASQMAETYQDCLQKLGCEPKIVLPFFPLMPGVMVDKFINNLFDLAGDIPVFGGITTNDLIQTKAAVFANGMALSHQMVLLMLGGDIAPVFAVGSQVTCMAEYGPTVTKSDHNVVYRVDDMSFCEYLSSMGVAPEKRLNGVDALLQYGPLPVLLRQKRKDNDGIAEIRCISHTNVESGSAAFSSDLPEGTKLNVSILHKEDVVDSAYNCLHQMAEKIKEQEKNGYEYSVLLCISCVARYFALVGGDNLERQVFNEKIPAKLATSSYYGFCEICPTNITGSSVTNRSHNASVIMCAF